MAPKDLLEGSIFRKGANKLKGTLKQMQFAVHCFLVHREKLAMDLIVVVENHVLQTAIMNIHEHSLI